MKSALTSLQRFQTKQLLILSSFVLFEVVLKNADVSERDTLAKSNLLKIFSLDSIYENYSEFFSGAVAFSILTTLGNLHLKKKKLGSPFFTSILKLKKNLYYNTQLSGFTCFSFKEIAKSFASFLFFYCFKHCSACLFKFSK